jgi:uncharacterized OsmC-like protein
MAAQDIAAALDRVASALQRHPASGTHADMPATARWQGGTHVLAIHPQGATIPTDMPGALGGTGEHVTPGWLFRAGLASCAATSIVLAAARQDIALTQLEVRAESNSDTRGLLGMREPSGAPVHAGPFDMQLHVRIAGDASAETLQALVDDALAHSPIPSAVRSATALALHIDVPAT